MNIVCGKNVPCHTLSQLYSAYVDESAYFFTMKDSGWEQRLGIYLDLLKGRCLQQCLHQCLQQMLFRIPKL